MQKVEKHILIKVIETLIQISITDADLIACYVIVHDIVWTRLKDDQTAKQMKSDISVKRASLSIQ